MRDLAPKAGVTDEPGLGKARSFRRLDPLSDPNWDRNLENVPGANIFHSSAWARVLRGAYGYTPYYFLGEAAAPRTALCLSEVDSWITGRRASSLPFADECEILGISSQGAEFNEVANFCAELARTNRWKSIEFRGVPANSENALPSYYGHDLDLRASPAQLFANCDSSARRAVRKAQKSGVTVQIETSRAALREYFRLHCLTRQKHGVPPQPFRFFEQIHLHIIERGLGFIALAKLGSRVLAGAIFFHFAGKALYKFGASDPAADSLRPSNLIMWTGIEHLAAHGHQTLSFGRTSLGQEGLRRYKLGWGAKERMICYLQIRVSIQGYVAQPIRSGRDSNPLLSKMPLPVLRTVGRWIYPHLG